MLRTILAIGAAMAALSFSEASAAPRACSGPSARIDSRLFGTSWNWHVRDDGGDWGNMGRVTFNADGTWTELNTIAGHWCMVGDTLIFGYDAGVLGDTLNSTFRLQYGPRYMLGTESWDAGGTGIVEMTRQ